MVGQLGSAVMVQQSAAVKEPMAQERERKRRWMAALESGVVEEHVSAAFGGHDGIHCAGACNNARLSNALAMGDRKRRVNKRVESRKRVLAITFLGKDEICLFRSKTHLH